MKYLKATVLYALFSISLGQNLTVQTQQGPVTGTLITPGVRQFLGIPYATANRWQPPQPPAVRSTTFLATAYGNGCVQQITPSNREFLSLFGLSNQQLQVSETCLSLNIWTPSSDRKQGTAVMIWIYGGGYEFGASNTIFYNGTILVQNWNDILVVTLNYRMNIFGFPSAPQLNSNTQTQNFGALDVEAAIQWVYNNVATFGGDPNRIMLFGQSAGSGIASAYTFSHPADTIVKGIIEESGSMAGMPSLITTFGQPFNPNAWTAVATIVGCGNVSTPAQFTCMQDIPATTLASAAVTSQENFVPTQDGITFFTDATSRSAAGNFLKVPLLVGNTAQEGDIFLLALQLLNPSVNFSSVINTGSDLITEVAFTCPAGITAGDYVNAGVPVWRYRYEAIFPDISTSGLRAYHASEIPIVFGTYNSSTFGPGPTVSEIALSQYVQGAWVAFARDPHQGLANYGWPRYDPLTATLVQLGNNANPTGAILSQGNTFDGNCQMDFQDILLIEQILAALGILP